MRYAYCIPEYLSQPLKKLCGMQSTGQASQEACLTEAFAPRKESDLARATRRSEASDRSCVLSASCGRMALPACDMMTAAASTRRLLLLPSISSTCILHKSHRSDA